MSSAKPKVKASVNRQVKAAIRTVRDFIAGKSGEAKVADSADRALRQVVAAELLTAMSGPDTAGMSHGDGEKMSSEQESTQNEQERARQLFLDHGYLDEAVQDLRAANSPAERAAAARTLGIVGSGLGNVHLIAALFDDAQEVRDAAAEALAQLGDPAVANAPLANAPTNNLLNNEIDAEKTQAFGPAIIVDELAPAEPAAQDWGGPVEQPSGSGAPAEIHPTRAARVGTPLLGLGPPAAGMPGSAGAPGEWDEPVSAKSPVEEVQVAVRQAIVDDKTVSREEDQLLLEEDAVRKVVEELERRLLETSTVRKEAEKEARLRTEREAKLRAEAATRRSEEEELRKRADEEAEHRRLQEREAVTAEQEARLQAEAETHRLAEEEGRLRLEAAGLRLAAEELARQRADIETARREAGEAARHTEAKRARQEAEERHKAELEGLRSQEEALRIAVEEVAFRRAEVEAARQEAEAEIARLTEERAQLAAAAAARHAEAERRRREAEDRNRAEQEQLLLQVDGLRHAAEEVAVRRAELAVAREKADDEAQRLSEAQARMRAEEEARNQAEAERLQLEAEIHERTEKEQRLLEEARHWAQEEQERLHEETRRRIEEEEHRLAELEVLRTKTETEAWQRIEKEQLILSQLESLRIADAETRKRIEDAEGRQRTAEETSRLAAEKVQRVETEAHVRAVEEERILARLEALRRNVAAEAQARAEQEKRIEEEIELFRRLEEEERPRVEAATLRRVEAEDRLQQLKDRLKAEEESRLRAEEQLTVLVERSAVEEPSGQEGAAENGGPARPPATDEALTALTEKVAAAGPQDSIFVDNGAGSGVTPTVVTYLNSVDPYKRAAAVAEVARSGAKDAFTLIANCFDDDSPHVRNAAARALQQLEPSRTVELFNRALEEGTAQRRRNIGSAIANSGLATEAVDNLDGESREDTYNALCILFVMAKTGEVQPLVRAIEEHQDDEVCKAAIKLLTLSGQSELADAALKRRAEAHHGRGATA